MPELASGIFLPRKPRKNTKMEKIKNLWPRTLTDAHGQKIKLDGFCPCNSVSVRGLKNQFIFSLFFVFFRGFRGKKIPEASSGIFRLVHPLTCSDSSDHRRLPALPR